MKKEKKKKKAPGLPYTPDISATSAYRSSLVEVPVFLFFRPVLSLYNFRLSFPLFLPLLACFFRLANYTYCLSL
jgi:hypothetical protein